ncbi:helix-turn-helix domain-containing protein [Roseovarius sp. SCSIO 43702]|uniref:GlxA family transcriptional regulator n=1 Tax=Roseovarius sp. SCSIO 43702 TaxID=2823043 RepID=UPI001C72AC31|nr:helix-turn-helix domain-containing protein [Roseovarius sp. SCSIO 43702]QYX56466.1 helix-turn-helix domain-containing protein [Roseovarius sp. SCSIO 43702]
MSDPRDIIRFDLLLTEGFVLTEYAGVVDQLRLANRVMLRPAFAWRSFSRRGGPVACLSDAVVETLPFAARPEAEYVFVLGNSDPAHPDLSMGRVIDAYVARGTKVILLAEAAARFIEERGDTGLTTHWENRALLAERMELGEGAQALATERGQIITSAGMGSTVDMVLTLMARHIPAATVATVTDILLHDRVRDLGTLQPFGTRRSPLTGDAELDRAVELMQANIEEPLPIAEIVRLVGVSARSLERRFAARLRARPAEYYRALRLNRANNLLLNTSMPISEIALACGFSSGFTPRYRAEFGLTPQAARRRARGVTTAR